MFVCLFVCKFSSVLCRVQTEFFVLAAAMCLELELDQNTNIRLVTVMQMMLDVAIIDSRSKAFLKHLTLVKCWNMR